MSEETCHVRTRRECTTTFFQLLFVTSFVITELLSIRLSLLRLNPPRLMITQALRYFGMSLAGLLLRLSHHCRGRRRTSDSGHRLPLTAAATLTLMDIGADTAVKVAHMLAPSHIADCIFGLLSLAQSFMSFAVLGQRFSLLQLAGSAAQTAGYVLVCTSCAPEPHSRQAHPLFGAMQGSAGVFFALVALTLQCLSITMTEALSTAVKVTVGELCRGNGFVGMILTNTYHAVVLLSKTERYVVLVPSNDIAFFCVAFVAAAACQQWAQCWLVLHTRAVEYARVAMFAALLEFAIRHTVYREDGAAYGFCQVPQAGAALTVVGLVLIGLAQPAAVAPRVEHSAGQCEA